MEINSNSKASEVILTEANHQFPKGNKTIILTNRMNRTSPTKLNLETVWEGRNHKNLRLKDNIGNS